MVGRSMNNWGMSNHSRLVNNGGMIRGRCRVVGSSVVDDRSVIGGSMVDSMMDRGSVVARTSMSKRGGMRDNYGSCGVISSNISWSVGRGDGSGMGNGSRVLLRIMVSVNSLGSSMRLAHHSSGVGTMSFVN